MTDAEAAAAIRARLEGGETLLWSQAGPPGELSATALVFALFATLWIAFVGSAVWRMVVGRLRMRAEGLPTDGQWAGFTVAGLMVVIGIFVFTTAWNEFISAWWTSYGLTDRRVIVAREFPIRSTMSYGRGAFELIDIEGAGGRGAIRFDYGEAGKGGDNFRESLHGVEAPDELAARIREVLAQDQQTPPPP